MSFDFALRQRWQQQGRKDCNDRDSDQQFDQRKRVRTGGRLKG
jgi:hypothetical protein